MPQHKTSKIPLFAFRGNRSVDEMAKIPFQTETLFTDQDFSCDIYSDCGIDN